LAGSNQKAGPILFCDIIALADPARLIDGLAGIAVQVQATMKMAKRDNRQDRNTYNGKRIVLWH
jgi:hypothetical protein